MTLATTAAERSTLDLRSTDGDRRRLRQRRAIRAIVLLCALGAVGFTAYETFLKADGPLGEIVVFSTSPDGEWEILEYYDAPPGAGKDSSYVEARPAGGGREWEQLYYGSPADFAWGSGSTLVATQIPSGEEIVLRPSEGQGYDMATATAGAVLWNLGLLALVFFIVYLVGAAIGRIVLAVLRKRDNA